MGAMTHIARVLQYFYILPRSSLIVYTLFPPRPLSQPIFRISTANTNLHTSAPHHRQPTQRITYNSLQAMQNLLLVLLLALFLIVTADARCTWDYEDKDYDCDSDYDW